MADGETRWGEGPLVTVVTYVASFSAPVGGTTEKASEEGTTAASVAAVALSVLLAAPPDADGTAVGALALTLVCACVPAAPAATVVAATTAAAAAGETLAVSAETEGGTSCLRVDASPAMWPTHASNSFAEMELSRSVSASLICSATSS